MRRRLVSREAEPVSPPSRRGGSVSVPPARPASGWSPSSRRRVCGGSLWSAIVSERPGSSAPVSAPRAPRRAADLLRRRRRVPLGQGRRREVGLAGSPHPVASDGPHVLAAAPRPADCACRKEPASRGPSSDSSPSPLLTGRAPRASSLASRNVSARCEASTELSTSHLHPCTSAVITDFLDTLICLKRRARSQSRGVAEAPVRRAVVSAVLWLAPLAGTQGAGGGGGQPLRGCRCHGCEGCQRACVTAQGPVWAPCAATDGEDGFNVQRDC